MKIMIENIGKSILIICFIFMFLLGIFIFKNDVFIRTIVVYILFYLSLVICLLLILFIISLNSEGEIRYEKQ